MRSLKDDTTKFNETCSCKDPIKCLEHMFVDMVQKKRVAQGQCPVRRPVFLRTHGIIRGEMDIMKDIPESLKQGMFADSGKHPVYVRYSSDLADGRPDWESTIGIGIKIFDIPGEKVVSDDGANVADLILQNVPFFFVNNASDFCNFTKASLEGWGDQWIQENSPQTSMLLDKMAKPIRSVFGTALWSVVPFRLGKDNYCKYIVKPGTSTFADDPNIVDPNFLGKDLAARMAASDATIDIYIQPRPSVKKYGAAWLDEHFPLDKATVVWDEKIAPPVKVAQITLPKQDIEKAEQEIYGDWLDFNIGRVPKDNEPVGSISEARKVVYAAAAKFRHDKNGQPNTQPSKPGKPVIKNPTCPLPGQPKPDEAPKPLTQKQIERITEVRIHPGIGIARVGNSISDYYIGPEVTNPILTKFGATRDDGGAIKRQAARFRIYGYDAQGNVVAEIQQSSNSSVEWSVHVANRKAQWYEFDAAMDLPETSDVTVPLRNKDIKDADRGALAIDPGLKKIMGLNMDDSSYLLAGEFQGTSVTLGELRTDSVGRLVFLGGHGNSDSPANTPVYDPAMPSSFNNAAGWYDDICDGPVHAKVSLGNKTFQADPAWVCSAPPNFAPDIVGWRTMDDLVRQVYIQAGMMELPKRVSFMLDVYPILQRLTGLQWVNKGLQAYFGAGAQMNFENEDFVKRIAMAPDPGYPDPFAQTRRNIYNSFRASSDVFSAPDTTSNTVQAMDWPMIYGDLYGADVSGSDNVAATYLQLPDYFDFILQKWVSGDFISDFDPAALKRETLNDVPLQQQPEMLDRANLHFCLADAFHPGCELTWPMRHASMYRAPYRIRERQAGLAQPTYGSTLDQNTVLSFGGPLFAQGNGDLTRWMALPWQGDTAFCRSGYDMEFDPYMPTYWPARVPNQILTKVDYEILMDKDKKMDLRVAAFQNRPSWLRQLPGNEPAADQMLYMVKHFGEMGILEAKPRPDDMDWLPEHLYVENLTEVKQKELEEAYKVFQENYAKLGPTDRLLQEAGWFSEEHRNEFTTIVRGK